MKHITFDYLSKDEVTEIITKGARLLNIEFTQEVIDEIIKCSMKNAYLVQHICRQVLTDKGILKRSKTIFEISDTNDVHAACKNIAKILDLDYGNIYKTIASGSRAQQKHTAFNQYEEILKAIKHFTIKDIEAGIDHKQIANIAWNNIPQEKRVRYISNNTYQSESSFKSSINTQIKNAIAKINENIKYNQIRETIYAENGKIYLTDLVFKFYIDWI